MFKTKDTLQHRNHLLLDAFDCSITNNLLVVEKVICKMTAGNLSLVCFVPHDSVDRGPVIILVKCF